MNLIRLLDTLQIDDSLTESPVRCLLLKEILLENGYVPLFWGGYDTIFNKEILNEFFEGKVSFSGILRATKNISKLQLEYKNVFFPLIKERLKEIKELPDPRFTLEQMQVLRAFADTPNAFIPLPYIMKSVHKQELLTLLAITDWDVDFLTSMGWGIIYTAVNLKFHNIFEIGELEVYLPPDEIKILIDNINEEIYEEVYNYLEESKKANEEDKEILTRLSGFRVKNGSTVKIQ